MFEIDYADSIGYAIVIGLFFLRSMANNRGYKHKLNFVLRINGLSSKLVIKKLTVEKHYLFIYAVFGKKNKSRCPNIEKVMNMYNKIICNRPAMVNFWVKQELVQLASDESRDLTITYEFLKTRF